MDVSFHTVNKELKTNVKSDFNTRNDGTKVSLVSFSAEGREINLFTTKEQLKEIADKIYESLMKEEAENVNEAI